MYQNDNQKCSSCSSREAAKEMLEETAVFAADPRTEHMMAVFFVTARIAGLGRNALASIDRSAFITHLGEGGENAHWDLLADSASNDRFSFKRFFRKLEELSSPMAAAATVAVLFHDLLKDGQREAVEDVFEAVRTKIGQHWTCC